MSVREIAQKHFEAWYRLREDAPLTPHIEAAIREAAKPLVAELERIGSAIDDAAAHWDREGTGGMQVPFHGDFGQATPSVRSRLRWHGRNINTALAAWRDGK